MDMLETDYLVIGAGAAAMAFADALIAESEVDVLLVERRHCAGGHWNDAYPFVRIHHASACYGVNSLPLGKDLIEETGINAGMYERSSAAEVCAYFQRVLEEVLIPSGQVRFFGMCDYIGDWEKDHRFTSRVTGITKKVTVRRKIVDTTYLDVTVPATHTPSFSIDSEVSFIPLGELVNVDSRPSGYTIIGAGKTAMDACTWLLENGETPERIRWIRPREPWTLDRMTLQPLSLVSETINGISLSLEALARSSTMNELWRLLEDSGQIFRFDQNFTPRAFRGAILSTPERENLMQIERVVRKGRVKHLGPKHIILEEGEIPTETGHIHVDCTACGYHKQPIRPIFEPNRIVIQSLVGVVQTYYAAMIGFIESTSREESEKNRLCPPVAQVDEPLDWIRYVHGMLNTSILHSSETDILNWQGNSRLNLTKDVAKHQDDRQMQIALKRWEANKDQAFKKAEAILASV